MIVMYAFEELAADGGRENACGSLMEIEDGADEETVHAAVLVQLVEAWAADALLVPGLDEPDPTPDEEPAPLMRLRRALPGGRASTLRVAVRG
jgi:hypothetical protein